MENIRRLKKTLYLSLSPCVWTKILLESHLTMNPPQLVCILSDRDCLRSHQITLLIIFPFIIIHLKNKLKKKTTTTPMLDKNYHNLSTKNQISFTLSLLYYSHTFAG